jgi:hypothetical protein
MSSHNRTKPSLEEWPQTFIKKEHGLQTVSSQVSILHTATDVMLSLYSLNALRDNHKTTHPFRPCQNLVEIVSRICELVCASTAHGERSKK